MNILIPLDESEKTFESLNMIELLSKNEDLIIHLLHIIDEVDVLDNKFPVYSDPRYRNGLKEKSKEILNKAESLLKEYKVNKISISGASSSVVKDILKAIEENNIDIVIMTKTGEGFYHKYIIGSITSRIIKLSPVPVIIVP